jgi:hypothetical protein
MEGTFTLDGYAVLVRCSSERGDSERYNSLAIAGGDEQIHLHSRDISNLLHSRLILVDVTWRPVCTILGCDDVLRGALEVIFP